MSSSMLLKAFEIRIYRDQSGSDLPRPARLAGQLRRQSCAGDHPLQSRRDRRGFGSRLRARHRASRWPPRCITSSVCSMRRWRFITPGLTGCRSSCWAAPGPMDSANRRPWIDWVHTANVQGNLVRDFVQVGRSAGERRGGARFLHPRLIGWRPPTRMGPVYICYDGDVQEKQLDGEVTFPSLAPISRAAAAASAGRRLRKRPLRWLLAAKQPVILADWVGRREAGFNALGELAELLAAPVLDQFGRFNFPVQHPLNLTGQSGQGDSAGGSDSSAGCSRPRRRHRRAERRSAATARATPLMPADAKSHQRQLSTTCSCAPGPPISTNCAKRI